MSVERKTFYIQAMLNFLDLFPEMKHSSSLFLFASNNVARVWGALTLACLVCWLECMGCPVCWLGSGVWGPLTLPSILVGRKSFLTGYEMFLC